ncbi:MAG: hypothetical protein HJJLKODD_02272 [Phycisphaerae bacterium]|nr:hypothetical protein [Phycisphaerae bacterium]
MSVILLAGMLFSVLLQQPATESQPTEPATQAVTSRPAVPHPLLSTSNYPPTFTSEEQYQAYLDEEYRRVELLLQSSSTPDPSQVLALANWNLSVRAEPMISSILQQINTKAELNELQKLLLQTRTLLDKSASEDDLNKDQAQFLRLMTDVLEAWSQAQDGQRDAARLDSLANTLAVWLDDDRAEISDYALFWQSLIYAANERWDRALATLPEAMRLSSEQPISLYLAGERCRILARRQQPDLAVALLLKLEESTAQAYSSEAQGQQARCTLIWWRWQILQHWPATTQPVTQELQQEMSEQAAAELQDQDVSCSLLRLLPAIPVVTDIPNDWKLWGSNTSADESTHNGEGN